MINYIILILFFNLLRKLEQMFYNDKYITHFSYYCRKGNTEMVINELNNKYKKVSYFNKRVGINKKTGFFTACKNGHYDIAEILIDDPRIDINKRDVHNISVFMHVCINGDYDIAKLLLENKRYKIDKRESGDYMYFAYESKNRALFKLLINSDRIDINCKIKQVNKTIFHYIFVCCDAEMISLLLKKPKLDVNLGNGKETPFGYFCKYSNSKVDYFMIKKMLMHPNLDPFIYGESIKRFEDYRDWIQFMIMLYKPNKECFKILSKTETYRSNDILNSKNISFESKINYLRKVYKISHEFSSKLFVMLNMEINKKPFIQYEKRKKDIFDILETIIEYIDEFASFYFDREYMTNKTLEIIKLKKQIKFIKIMKGINRDVHMRICNYVYGINQEIIKNCHIIDAYKEMCE